MRLGPTGPVSVLGQAVALFTGDSFKVRSGTEGASSPGQNSDPGLGIVFKIPKCGGQFFSRGAIHGISHFRPIDNDRGDRAIFFH